MNFDDYEQLPTPSTANNMIAGGAAGILEHCVMYPVDSIKTRMQSLLGSSNQTLVSTFRNMIKNEGIGRPFRGIGAVVAGAGPAHACYFATYEHVKEVMSDVLPQYDQSSIVVAGVTATLIHDAISNPTEVIKQRLQMYNSPYRTVLSCAVGVYRTEGVRAFYRSYVTQLCMNLPHQTIHFSTYEFFQNKLNKERKYNPLVHVIAGGAAGALASAFTTPLDVVKTLLNTQETGVGATHGMRAAITQIHAVAGPLGFFKGLGARVLYTMPATAICWSTYEFFKFMLSSQTHDDYRSTISGSRATAADKPTDKKKWSSSAPDDVVAATKSASSLRYVIPKPTVIATDIISESSTPTIHHSASAELNVPGPQYMTATTTRELPSISSVGMYTAINMNSVHTDATGRTAI